MLFHKGPLSGVSTAAIRYFTSATSKSPCSCSMQPAAKIAFTFVGSNVIDFPRCSNAIWYSAFCKQHSKRSLIQSLIQICITLSLGSTSRFIPSASPVLSQFTFSSTCQPISLIIHHSFTPGSKPTFSTNPSHLRLLLTTGLPSW